MADDAWDAWSEDRSGVSVTLKADKGYEAPWIVFHGTPEQVARDIEAMLDIDGEGISVAQLAVNADIEYKALYVAGSKLGAKSVPESESESPFKDPDEKPKGWGGKPKKGSKEKTKEESDEDPLQWVYDAIASIDEEKALVKFWAENNQIMSSSPELTKVWKARGRELKKAAG